MDSNHEKPGRVGETNNLAAREPDRVAHLTALLRQIREGGRGRTTRD